MKKDLGNNQSAGLAPKLTPEEELINLAVDICEAGEYARALDLCEQALKINPKSARADCNSGASETHIWEHQP